MRIHCPYFKMHNLTANCFHTLLWMLHQRHHRDFSELKRTIIRDLFTPLVTPSLHQSG